MEKQISKPQGCFVAVVGSSGAGKDTIMDKTRAALADDERFHFVRRIITRPQMPGTEDHDSLDEAAFAKAAEEDAFALDWQAHGLRYGLPQSLNQQIAMGTVVIANVSRHVLDEIRKRFAQRSIILITASPEILAERLAARGRETRDEIAARLKRTVAFDDSGEDVVTIDNSGEVQTAADAFIDHLIKLSNKTTN